MKLRDYQQACKQSIYDYIASTETGNPVAVIPTGGGKTPVIASIASDSVLAWDGRIIILAHVKELLNQAIRHLLEFAPELHLRVGVHSAGLGSRDMDHSCIVAGIQSVYKKACDLGRFDLAVIDEAHRIPPEGEGMYRQFIKEARAVNPGIRLIGLTATPYRMKSGSIAGPDCLFDAVVHETSVKELINRGWLSKLTSKGSKIKTDFSGLHVRAGEFVQSETEALMGASDVVKAAAAEIVRYATDRRSVLVFASGIGHARDLERAIARLDPSSAVVSVFGETDDVEREASVKGFTSGEIKYLINVEVFTLGFDAPNVDLVALVRPTRSPGLYYQMVGRGFRLHPGKENCLVLDFGGNILRHGPVDALAVSARRGAGRTGEAGGDETPSKQCPDCSSIVHAGYSKCPDCGHDFEMDAPKHSSEASHGAILSGEPVEHEVLGVSYSVYRKRGAPEGHPTTLRVDYRIGDSLIYGGRGVSEFICFNHPGFARTKAVRWWRDRSDAPVPASVEEAFAVATTGVVAEPESILCRQEGRYERVVSFKLRPKPDLAFAIWTEEADEFLKGMSNE